MPYCPDVYPWFLGEESIHACQDPGNQPGQAVDVGCGSCCRAFDLLSDNFQTSTVGVSATGSRFLRPSPTFESRNAYGDYTWVASDVPVRLPLVSCHQLAMCWQMNFGGVAAEFWDDSICSCKFFCPGDPGHGCWIPRFNRIQTCQWYIGYDSPPEMYCTGIYLGDQPETIMFAAGSLGQAAFVSLGDWEHQWGMSMGGAVSNVLAMCRWKAPECEEDCELYAGSLFPGEYVSPNHSIWNRVYVRQIAAEMYCDPESPDPDHARIAGLKNRALAWLADDASQGFDGICHLDQMDGSLTAIDWWSREWSAASMASMPVVATWPNCRLRWSGLPVIADWVVASASIEASIVLYRRRTLASCQATQSDLHKCRHLLNYRASIRLRVRMAMALRARFATDGPHQLIRDWLPEDADGRVVDLQIENRQNERVPRVLPVLPVNGRAADHIVYVDGDGYEFADLPPLDAVWWGEQGPLCEGGWPNLFPDEWYVAYNNWSIGGECCGVGKGFHDVRVASLESDPDADAGERQKLYSGFVRIGVDHELGGLCPP